MSDSIVFVTRALDFAARRHQSQRRKGAAAEPYINHLAEVACLVADATGGEDAELVVAALLHDTIEDTGTTRAELEQRFGEDVASLVCEVTDDKRLEKGVRKQLQVEKAPRLCARAKLLKIADKISNLRSILESPPADWGPDRKRAYFSWAKAVVDGCRGVNGSLEAQFDAAHERGARELDEQG